MREDVQHLLGVAHIFLHAKVGYPQIEVQRRGHTHRRKIGRAVWAGTHLVKRGKIGDAAHTGDASRVGNRGTDVVDKLLFNQLLAIPDAIKDFAYRNRRHGVLANQTEARLVLCWRWVFHPEQTIIFNALTKTRRFNRRQAVVHVMQQMLVKAELVTNGIKQLRREIEVFFRGPQLLFRPLPFGRRFVGQPFPLGHTIGRFHPRYAALDANRFEAHLFMTRIIFQHIINGMAGGVTVNHHAFARRATQQLIQRHVGGFGFNIPQRHIDGGDSRHRDRAATPVSAFIEELPDIFDAVRITPHQLRAQMIF